MMKSYTIHYDRTLLLLKGILNMILLLVSLILLALLPLNPISIFLVATLCWFLGKASGRAFIRFFKQKPLCILDDAKVELAMPSGDGKIMKIKDITLIERKTMPHRIQLVFHGKNIEHPSGAYLIDINHPFSSQQLKAINDSLNKWFTKHQLRVEEVQTQKKEVQASVSSFTENR